MLLDTNAFIWFVEGNARLKAPMRAAIADPAIPVKLSIVSFWEMAIKHRKGKLPLPAPFADGSGAGAGALVRARGDRCCTT